MIRVHGVRGETVSWFDRKPARSNQHCLYCGVFVGEGAIADSDKEHLIGRNFVPPGALKGSFNFFSRSCRECNGRKASAERHISSVTLVNSPGRANDVRVNEAASRKATGDFHPDKKGIPIGQATDDHSVEFTWGALSVNIGGISPPQVNREAAQLLAFNHIQALFALVTTEDCRVPEKMRLLPHTHFRYFGHYGYQDWGNPHLIEVARRVGRWPCFANITAAGGYFRAILKRSEDQGWFWALEWNRYLRVVGAIVHENQSAEVFQALPILRWKPLPDGSGRYRPETPLVAEADHLFSGAPV
jgi:hypothetical protein